MGRNKIIILYNFIRLSEHRNNKICIFFFLISIKLSTMCNVHVLHCVRVHLYLYVVTAR